MIYLFLAFFLLAISPETRAQLSFSPAGPYCDGDTVTFTCILEPPAGDSFISSLAEIRFTPDPSTTCYTRTQINNNNTGPIDSTRYNHQFTVSGISSPNASAVLEINTFLTVDASIPFSCCVTTNSAVLFISNSTSPMLAAQPFAAIINNSTTFDPANSCTGNITLTWLAVTSDRNVTSYEVLLNGTVNTTFTTPMSMYIYTSGALNLLEYYATYTVVAVSCAGSSISSPVIFIPPAPPSTVIIINSTAYNPAISCNGTITLAWLAVASDRPVTSYEVLLNGTNINTITTPMAMNSYTTVILDLISHYATYTVIATSCAGNSTSSPVMFTPPTPPSAPSVSISFPYDSDTSCTGNITLTWLAVASDRPLTNYDILLNGSSIDFTNPIPGMNNYTAVAMNLLEHYANYTVRAVSCAGSSTSSPVVFTPLTSARPSAASISISTTYASATSCTGTITLTWPAVIADRNVTSYEVLLNGTNVMTLSPTAGTNTYTTASMSLATFNGTYTVRAVNCVGATVSNEVMFTPPTTPSAPVIATSPNITSLQPSNCTARIAYTLQQPADSRNVTSYHLSSVSTVIQSLPANTGKMYSFYYGVTLNTAANLYITAENCVGNSSQLTTMLPIVQGVSIVRISTPTLSLESDGNLTYTVLFPADYVFEVNFTLYATAIYKNGNTETNAIFTAVQNTNMNSTRNILLRDLFDAIFILLFTDVDNISVMVTVNSQCGQALNISSVPIELKISPTNTTPVNSSTSGSTQTTIPTTDTTLGPTTAITTPTTAITTPTTANITTTTISTTAATTQSSSTTTDPNTEAQACGTGCLAGIAIGAIIIILLIVGAILAIICILICCRRRSNNNVKFSHDSGLFDKDTPRQSVRNEMEMTPSYNDDDMPTYAQVTKSIKKPPAVKSKPTELIYAEMDFSKDLPKQITESPEKPVIAETIYSMVTALDDSTDPQLYPNLDTAYQGAQYTPSSLYSNVS